MANVATLNIGINALYGGALSGFKAVTAGANTMATSLTNVGNTMGGFASSLTGIALAAVGLGGVIGTTVFALRAAADAEQTEIAFTTMLGSAEKAKKLIEDITKFAYETPFQLPGLKQSAKQLIAFGTESEQVLPVLKALGDVAAGVSVNVDELVLVYGHAQASGRVMNKEINQLTSRGIPIVAELAKVLGVAQTEIRGMAKHGEIGFSALQQAFVNMSSEGGKFNNLMGKQSQTLGGLWSNLQDNVGISLQKIGTAIADAFELKYVLGGLIAMTTWVRDTAVPSMLTAFNFLKAAILPVWNAIAAAGHAAWDFLAPLVSEAYTAIQPMIPFTLTLVGSFLALASVPAIWTTLIGVIGGAAAILATFIAPLVSLPGIIAVGVAFAVDQFGGWGAVIQALTPTFQALWGVILTGLDYIKYGLVVTFATGTYIAQNFSKTMEFLATSILYSAYSWVSYLGDFFTRVWPIMGENFVSQSVTFFKNWSMYIGTVLDNLKENFVTFINAVWTYIKTGGTSGWDFAWKPLAEGFQMEIAKVQPIAEREIDGFEQALKDRSEELGLAFGEGLADYVGKALEKNLSPNVTKYTTEATDKIAEAAKGPEIPGIKISEDDSIANKAGNVKDAQLPQAFRRGSAEAFTAVANFRANGADDKPAEETAKNTREAVKELGELNRWLARGDKKRVLYLQ